MIDWIKEVAAFASGNWQMVTLGGMATLGLGLFGFAFKNVQALLAAAMIALVVGFAGHFYRQGAEHELALERAAHKAGIDEMARLREIDEARIAELRSRIGNAPAATGIAIKAERAKRIGDIR